MYYLVEKTADGTRRAIRRIQNEGVAYDLLRAFTEWERDVYLLEAESDEALLKTHTTVVL